MGSSFFSQMYSGSDKWVCLKKMAESCSHNDINIMGVK